MKRPDVLSNETATDPIVLQHADGASSTCVAVTCLGCTEDHHGHCHAGGHQSPQWRCPLCRGALAPRPDGGWRPDPMAQRMAEAAPRRCLLCDHAADNWDGLHRHHRLDCTEWRLRAVLVTHRSGGGCDCDSGGACRAGLRLATELSRFAAAAADQRSVDGACAQILEWMLARRRERPNTAMEGLTEGGVLVSPDLLRLWTEACTRSAVSLSEAIHILDVRTRVCVSVMRWCGSGLHLVLGTLFLWLFGMVT